MRPSMNCIKTWGPFWPDWLNPRQIFLGFWYGVSNLVVYFSIIWRDRDWDQAFLYRLLSFKLDRMHKLLNSERAVAEHKPRHLRDLKICSLLLKRLTRDNYFELAGGKKLERAWDHESVRLENGLYHWTFREDPEAVAFRHQVGQKMQELEDQDLEHFCKTFHKQVRSWWD